MRLLTFFALGILPCQTWAQDRRADNPFRRDTGRYEMPVENRQLYQTYSLETKRRLSKAITDAEGKGHLETQGIYLAAIRDVVLNLSRLEDQGRAKELLVPTVLRGALELSYGIPDATGKGIEEPGMLAGTENPDLMPLILENSIHMAMRLSDWDMQNLNNTRLASAPYFAMATERLRFTGEWMSGEMDSGRIYRLGARALHQWLRVVDSPLNMSANLYGELILSVSNQLADLESSTSSVDEKARTARGLYLSTYREVKRIAEAQTDDPTKGIFASKAPSGSQDR